MINDKSEALISYKYHIAIENCSNGPSENYGILFFVIVLFFMEAI